MADKQQSRRVWKLLRYGRFVASDGQTPLRKEENSRPQGTWKLFGSEDGALSLSLTETNHLLLTKGAEVLEGFSLHNAQQWLKAVHKGDSLLFVSKLNNESRMFRVQVAPSGKQTGIACCAACVRELSKYLPVNTSVISSTPIESKEKEGDKQKEDKKEDTDTEAAMSNETFQISDGRVAVSDMAKILTGTVACDLPLAYQQTNLLTEPDHTDAILRLCLTDSNFPAFVGQVETRMQEIIEGRD
ncbi:meiotic recombination protein REC114-like [Branchiostoma lanceolatum]|uniref:meiotic recombination protein REC114-like n=1 Tax=Branchiostoma lanceolatum TaxID=7740 RepID=UPI0034553D34